MAYGDFLIGASSPVVFLVPVVEDEERFGAVCGGLGERDRVDEAFEREGPAPRDGQHLGSDEIAHLGQRVQRDIG